MAIEQLIEYEEKVIKSFFQESLDKDVSIEYLNKIAYKAHRIVVGSLLWKYLCAKANLLFVDDYSPLFNLTNIDKAIEFNGNIETIPLLCEQLHVIYLNSKFQIKNGDLSRGRSKANLIELGAVYTKPDIATDIVKSTLSKCKKINRNFSVLDFACGTGRFYDAIIRELEKMGIAPHDSIINNIYAIDIDDVAVDITRLKALSHFDIVDLNIAKSICNHIIVRNALVKEDESLSDGKAIKQDDFDGKVICGFDAIVSNPPYLVLKPNKKKMDSESGKRLMDLVSYFRNSGIYHYSIEGMLNLYQLSLEAMLSMLKNNGAMGIICPSTLFADISATKLRKHLLLENKISSVKFYGEDAQLFENVLQATCIFILNKGGETKDISIQTKDKQFTVDLSLVKDLFPDNLEIPIITESEWRVISKLSRFTRLKELSHVRNRRGELDLTLCSKYITKETTPLRLIRGNMISPEGIRDCNHEFVVESFIESRSDDFRTNDLNKKRLICQQISNANQARRLKFIFCETNDILGNSCNYISSDEVTLKKLYLVLNSSVLNWRFKVTSSNNHINNYELAELPIIDLEKVDPEFRYDSQEELDSYIGHLYGLTKKEINLVAS